MKYFGHQCNASQDARLKRLRKASGSLGLDLYWRCLEIVGDKITATNTECRLEYSIEELTIEVESTGDLVEKALNVMVELGLCHKVPQSATICHTFNYYFPKILKYADKTMRNAYPGKELDKLCATMCHNVPQYAPKVVKVVEDKIIKDKAVSHDTLSQGNSELSNEEKASIIQDLYNTLEKPNINETHRKEIKKQIAKLEAETIPFEINF